MAASISHTATAPEKACTASSSCPSSASNTAWVDDTTIVFDGHVDYAGGRIVMRDFFRITDRGQGGEQVLSSTTTYRRIHPLNDQE